MRSKLEEQIATIFDNMGIKYTYEHDKLKYCLLYTSDAADE